MLGRNTLQKLLGRDTCPLLKQALEMKLAQMNMAGNFIQIRLLLIMSRNEVNRFPDTIEMIIIFHDSKVERTCWMFNPIIAEN